MNLSASRPRYILFSSSDRVQGTWRFSICSPTGTPILEASDREPETQGNRLDLLPVVLGLEALEQPSKITLWTPSRYVQEGLRFGLAEWQANGWQWEFFGEMTPVKNRDLWQRIERAMRFHQVECRFLRVDPPHRTPPGKNVAPPQGDSVAPSPSPPLSRFSGGIGGKDWVPLPPRLATRPPASLHPKEEGTKAEAEPAELQEDIPEKKVPVAFPAIAPPRTKKITPGEGITDQKLSLQVPDRRREEVALFFGGIVPIFSYSLLGSFLRPSSGAFFSSGKRLWSLLQGWISKLRPMLGNVFSL